MSICYTIIQSAIKKTAFRFELNNGLLQKALTRFTVIPLLNPDEHHDQNCWPAQTIHVEPV